MNFNEWIDKYSSVGKYSNAVKPDRDTGKIFLVSTTAVNFVEAAVIVAFSINSFSVVPCPVFSFRKFFLFAGTVC